MRTHIELKKKADSIWISDGKTENNLIDQVVELLYKKFPVFKLNITTHLIFSDGFGILVSSHAFYFREVFGEIRLNYQPYTSGEKYTISCTKFEGEASGASLEVVIDHFLKGTSQHLKAQIEFITRQIEFINSRVETNDGDFSLFHYVEYI